MLSAKGPWPHPYYEVPDTNVEVAFDDAEGHARRVKVRHKAPGKGPPLVLVHGLMTSSYSWRFVMEPLAEHYRVLMPDLVGAGATDKPIDLVYSVANVARFLAAYVRAVTAEPVYLVGNSLGGLCSVRALLDASAQGRQLARRFVLMHAPGYPAAQTRALNALLGAPLLGSALAELAEYGGLFATMDGARVFARILHESVDPHEHARKDAPTRTVAQIVPFDPDARSAA